MPEGTPQRNLETKVFGKDLIEGRIRELLGSLGKAVKEIKEVSVTGRGGEIQISLDIKAKGGNVSAEATLVGGGGKISLKQNPEIKTALLLVWLKPLISSQLGGVHEKIVANIEEKEGKRVQSIEIINGELKVTFVELPSMAPSPGVVEAPPTTIETPVKNGKITTSEAEGNTSTDEDHEQENRGVGKEQEEEPEREEPRRFYDGRGKLATEMYEKLGVNVHYIDGKFNNVTLADGGIAHYERDGSGRIVRLFDPNREEINIQDLGPIPAAPEFMEQKTTLPTEPNPETSTSRSISFPSNPPATPEPTPAPVAETIIPPPRNGDHVNAEGNTETRKNGEVISIRYAKGPIRYETFWENKMIKDRQWRNGEYQSFREDGVPIVTILPSTPPTDVEPVPTPTAAPESATAIPVPNTKEQQKEAKRILKEKEKAEKERKKLLRKIEKIVKNGEKDLELALEENNVQYDNFKHELREIELTGTGNQKTARIDALEKATELLVRLEDQAKTDFAALRQAANDLFAATDDLANELTAFKIVDDNFNDSLIDLIEQQKNNFGLPKEKVKIPSWNDLSYRTKRMAKIVGLTAAAGLATVGGTYVVKKAGFFDRKPVPTASPKTPVPQAPKPVKIERPSVAPTPPPVSPAVERPAVTPAPAPRTPEPTPPPVAETKPVTPEPTPAPVAAPTAPAPDAKSTAQITAEAKARAEVLKKFTAVEKRGWKKGDDNIWVRTFEVSGEKQTVSPDGSVREYYSDGKQKGNVSYLKQIDLEEFYPTK